jgi:hypothetical protein
MNMTSMRRFSVFAAVLLSVSTAALGQFQFAGQNNIDVAFGVPNENSLFVLDGDSGNQLWRRTESNGFGWAATAHPDISGNGRPDIVVTAPAGGGLAPGRVVALRGTDGALLWTCTYGTPDAHFGIGIGVIPDQNRDEVADVIVAMLSETDPSGEVGVLLSGKTGNVLMLVPGPVAPLLSATRAGELKLRPLDLDHSGSVDMLDVNIVIAAAVGHNDPTADVDFSGTVDIDDLLIVLNAAHSPSPSPPAQLLPGQYVLLSLEDPLRYNDGWEVVPFAGKPFQPTPASEPCAAEMDAARLAALEWMRHRMSPPGTINPFTWNAWLLQGDMLRDRFYAALGALNACRANLGLPPLQPGDLLKKPGQSPLSPPSPPLPPPPPPSPNECPLDNSYPPPTPSSGSPLDRCFNQLQTNILVCITCRDLNLAAEGYPDCLERAKTLFRTCKAREVSQ